MWLPIWLFEQSFLLSTLLNAVFQLLVEIISFDGCGFLPSLRLDLGESAIQVEGSSHLHNGIKRCGTSTHDSGCILGITKHNVLGFDPGDDAGGVEGQAVGAER